MMTVLICGMIAAASCLLIGLSILMAANNTFLLIQFIHRLSKCARGREAMSDLNKTMSIKRAGNIIEK